MDMDAPRECKGPPSNLSDPQAADAEQLPQMDQKKLVDTFYCRFLRGGCILTKCVLSAVVGIESSPKTWNWRLLFSLRNSQRANFMSWFLLVGISFQINNNYWVQREDIKTNKNLYHIHTYILWFMAEISKYSWYGQHQNLCNLHGTTFTKIDS